MWAPEKKGTVSYLSFFLTSAYNNTWEKVDTEYTNRELVAI